MNEGVKILLERMKTNPEEFAIGDGGFHTLSKWGRLIADYQTYLEPEDCEVLKNAINKLHQQTFTEKVMKELLAPEEDDSLGKPWYTGHPTGTLSAGQTQGAYTLNSGAGTGTTWANGTSAHLQQAQAAQNAQLHQLLHQKALAAQNLSTTSVVNKKPVVKKHKTLFGRLFNYQ